MIERSAWSPFSTASREQTAISSSRGAMTSSGDGRDAFLTELYLVPGARGRGLGSAALELAEVFARAHGARALHLMYRTENVVAGRLYLAHGYTSPPRVFLSKVL